MDIINDQPEMTDDEVNNCTTFLLDFVTERPSQGVKLPFALYLFACLFKYSLQDELEYSPVCSPKI